MKAIIYTTPTCASCHMVEKLFTRLKVDFKKVDVSQDPMLRQELYEKTGSMRVPITKINGKYSVGYNPSELIRLFNA